MNPEGCNYTSYFLLRNDYSVRIRYRDVTSNPSNGSIEELRAANNTDDINEGLAAELWDVGSNQSILKIVVCYFPGESQVELHPFLPSDDLTVLPAQVIMNVSFLEEPTTSMPTTMSKLIVALYVAKYADNQV